MCKVEDSELLNSVSMLQVKSQGNAIDSTVQPRGPEPEPEPKHIVPIEPREAIEGEPHPEPEPKPEQRRGSTSTSLNDTAFEWVNSLLVPHCWGSFCLW